MTAHKPYSPWAIQKRSDGLWWRTLAYCEDCGIRMGIWGKPAWCRVRIHLPEFRRNCICYSCAEKRDDPILKAVRKRLYG